MHAADPQRLGTDRGALHAGSRIGGFCESLANPTVRHQADALVGIWIDCGRPEGFGEARKDFPDGAQSVPVWSFNFPVPLRREFARKSLNQRSYPSRKIVGSWAKSTKFPVFSPLSGNWEVRQVRSRLPPPPRSPALTPIFPSTRNTLNFPRFIAAARKARAMRGVTPVSSARRRRASAGAALFGAQTPALNFLAHLVVVCRHAPTLRTRRRTKFRNGVR
jgi:hypothetical protein